MYVYHRGVIEMTSFSKKWGKTKPRTVKISHVVSFWKVPKRKKKAPTFVTPNGISVYIKKV